MPDEGIDPKLLEIGASGFVVAFEQAMGIVINETRKLVQPECLVTIMIRDPRDPDKDICFTLDDMEEVYWMVRRCIVREKRKQKDLAKEKTPGT